jgi:hypothetical protein
MQAARNLAVHGPWKLYLHQSDNLPSHGYLKFALSFSRRHEKLKNILIRGRESRECGNNSYDEIRAVLGRRQP